MSLEYLKIMRYRIYLKRKRYELIKNFFYDIFLVLTCSTNNIYDSTKRYIEYK